MKHIIEVKIKPKFTDALGDDFKQQSTALGVKNITDVRAGRLFALIGKLSDKDIKNAAHNLLTDNVVEQYRLNYSFSKDKLTHKIEVWLKNGVTDVVGESVKEAVLDMGIKNLEDARCGFVYYIKGKLSKDKLNFLADKILVNPLIHEFKVS